ncbi:MAG: hypothetical protein AAF050_14245 [Cyanobacteria bacterium J06649_5]
MTIVQESDFPNLMTYELPYDVDNGEFLASVVNRNPVGVVSLYIFPSNSAEYSDGSADDVRFLAHCKAGRFLGGGAKKLLDRYPKIDCKYHQFCLHVCDPQTPYKGDLLMASLRFPRFASLDQTLNLERPGSEGQAVLKALINKAPDANIVFLGAGDIWGQTQATESIVKSYINHFMLCYIGVYGGEGEITFEY